jgi:hypothetical protein
MEHPIAPESLEKFLRGEASQEENRRILAHLLPGCPSCAERLSRRSEPPANAYDAALDRFEESILLAQAPEKLDLPPPPLYPAAPRHRLSISKL